MWEITNLADIANNDFDRGDMPFGLDTMESLEEHKGWMYAFDQDSRGLYRSRTPLTLTLASWKLVSTLPASTSATNSLISIERSSMASTQWDQLDVSPHRQPDSHYWHR